MPITLLTGLAGSGKSTRLLEAVNAALGQGRPALTFACSDAPWLKGREDIQFYKVLTCRRPGLVAPLHHFVSAEESAEILRRTPAGTLVAFEEAQYFGPSLVPHWLEADQRGLDLLIASPSGGQLRRLDGHPCDRVHLVIRCQRCGAADAVGYFRLPDREATVSVCEPCRDGMVREGHRDIVERLRALPPSPGEEVIEQPVELPECAGWRVTRPDCRAVAGLMAFAIRRAGLAGEKSRLMSYLDVGCTTGYFCHHLRKLRFFAEGVDASEANVAAARLLDSYVRRDHNAFTAADPADYLRDARERGGRFDVTSALNAGPWLPPGEQGAACLRALFDVTDRLCFVTAGGADGVSVGRLMLEAGGFADVRVYDAAGHGLADDLYVGTKVAAGRPADAIHTVYGASTLENLFDEVDTLAGRLSRKAKIVDTLMVRLAARLGPQEPDGDGADGGLPADVARELRELQDQIDAENKAAEYRTLVWRVRLAAQAAVPAGATVAVVSRGDDELLRIEGRTAHHFPRNEAGVYCGSYPADSAEAVAQLEAAQRRGAGYLLLPSTAFWWLDHYEGLRRHLEQHGRLVARDADCAVYTLTPARPAAPAIPFPTTPVTFRCIICGTENTVPPERLEREARSCSGCGSSVRLRAVIHVLSLELFGRSLPLLEFPQRKDLVGAGMTDPDGYAMGLAQRFNYTNTYYHQEPRLDITRPDRRWEGALDFLISSEVFEHVPPPVSAAFDNLRRLMKPGGVVVFTVPYAKADRTVEHFPELHDYRVVEEDGRHVLRNRTKDGRQQVFDHLAFHGGPGETLEMRVFGEAALLDEFRRAGFNEVKVHREPCPEHGVYWREDSGLPVSARTW